MTKKVVSKKTNKLNYTKNIANIVGADASVRPQNQRAITLIALVITIIVMLILVAVTVTIAINGGLFGMAKKAKADTEEELAKENVLSTGRVKIGDKWYDSMEDYVNGTPSKNQSDDSAGGGSGTGHGGTYDAIPKNEENGTLTDNALWTEENGDTAVIPKGFKVVAGNGGDNDKSIENGLVIEDAKGNQFVWIPVNYIATGEAGDYGLDQGFLEVFYRSEWSNNTRTTGLSSNYTEPYANGYQGEDTEYYEMMKSVQKNGGFYIGRYEAGSETPRMNSSAGDTTMVVKRDQYPYIYVAWGKAMNDIENPVSSSEHGAVYLSKHMYEGNDKVGVVSTLCYGVQWDAMLDFIKDDSHNVTDSTAWGNYCNDAWTINRAEAKSSKLDSKNYELGEWTVIPSEGLIKTTSENCLLTTGAGDSFSAKNIYDVAGNCSEWTMEANSAGNRVVRGGPFNNDNYSHKASNRAKTSTWGKSNNHSFRPALYIKN